eukprot:4884-Eustigmatos_ZCMA.PRE.1
MTGTVQPLRVFTASSRYPGNHHIRGRPCMEMMGLTLSLTFDGSLFISSVIHPLPGKNLYGVPGMTLVTRRAVTL